jgi:hypothetical protein
MIIQKHFLKTTALALILSVTSLSPVSATKVTLQKHDWIGKDDSLIDIASKGATVLQTRVARERDGGILSQTQLVPYKEIAQVMEQDVQNVKAQVIASDTLTYPGKFEDYEQAFLRAVQKVLNKAPLNQISVEEYSDLAKNLPPQAFKALRSLMTKSKDRNEWALDNTLGGYFTLAQNKNGKLALIIKDLNVVLPLFKDQRLAEMDSWIPSGVVPSKLQQDTASLFSLILLNQPHKLKKGVQYRLQNQQEPLGDAWYYIENGRKKPLELPLVPFQPPKEFQVAQYLVTNGLFLLNSDLKDRFGTGGDYLFARRNESLADYFVRCVYGFGYVSQVKRGEKPNIIFQDMGDYFTRTVGIKDKKEYAEYIVLNGMYLLNSDLKDRFAIGQPYLKARQLESLEDYFTRVLYGFGYMSQLKRGEKPNVIFRDMSGYYTKSISK